MQVGGFPTSCVVNSFATDASGTIDVTTGESSVNIQLASRVFITLGQPTPCPTCVSGACSYGDNTGGACTSDNSQGTTLDCPPNAGTFVATLGVDLSPLTTGPNTVTAADGIFCPGIGQSSPGAFGHADAQSITQTGVPAGDGSDGLAHPATLVSNFCIPVTGSQALDSLADLPGPGSLSLPGEAQFVVVP